MSRFDYEQSKQITAGGPTGLAPTFAATIMAAIRNADAHNTWLLENSFPAITAELRRRYNAPGGYLPEDPDYPDYLREPNG